MALGKLWNAFFGKSAAVETGVPAANNAPNASQPVSSPPVSRPLASPAVTVPAQASVIAPVDQPAAKTITKVKRKAVAKGKKPVTPVAEVAAAPVVEPPRRTPPIARPQQNAWTKHVAGRSIGSILDTRLGDGARAVEVLQAIVCDSVPTPKYIAIDLFDLGNGRLTLMEFHQRIRRVGGNPVAIPADLSSGLRQLSQTHGTVDLVLLDGSEIDLTSLEFRRLLARVTHSESLVLHRDERGSWHSVPAAVAATKRTGAAETKAA